MILNLDVSIEQSLKSFYLKICFLGKGTLRTLNSNLFRSGNIIIILGKHLDGDLINILLIKYERFNNLIQKKTFFKILKFIYSLSKVKFY